MAKYIGYGSYGSVRGYGPLRGTREEAESDVRSDGEGCQQQGGYSDRAVVVVDSEGCCYYPGEDGGDDGELSWVPGAGGRTGGAARYEIPAGLARK